jgi:predicted Zn-dependent peptidase
MDYQTHVLPNGIRLIHIQSNTSVAHCGFFINAGSRDEKEHEHGVAHYIEHLLFKGTKRRKSFHILSRLEDVGGELNAYTTKEETCIHASFQKEYLGRALELISDIVFQSNFAPKAMDSEREVIIDEINSYKDSPSELIYDEFEENFFKGHPLSLNILGSIKSLKKINRERILSFIEANYHTNQMVLSSVGAIPFNKVKFWFEKYFGEVPSNLLSDSRTSFTGYTPFEKIVQRKTFQIHALLGNTGYDMKDERRIGLHLLSNIIGGPGMISRLNLALRERNGYSYNVESSYTPYSDSGLFTVYFSADKDNLDKCFETIYKEFDVLKNQPLGSLQLKKAKQQLTGQLAISFESYENQMLSAGKSLLVYNKVDSLEDLFAKIEAISASELRDIANEILDRNKISTLIYK